MEPDLVRISLMQQLPLSTCGGAALLQYYDVIAAKQHVALKHLKQEKFV